MGTLINQPPRDYKTIDQHDVINEIKSIEEIADVTGFSVDQVIKVRSILEMKRRNSLYVANGDIFDEQIGGIGQLIEEFRRILIDLTTK